MVFLRDVSYPRINQRRTGRFPIKLAHRLNHLRNLTIPKPFLRNRGVELPELRDRIVIQLPRRRCILPASHVALSINRIGKYVERDPRLKRNEITAVVIDEGEKIF